MRAHPRLLELAYSLGSISPNSRMRNVSMTVWSMKLSTGLIPSNTGPSAKLHSTTMVTLTRLLAMRMVASRRSGFSSRPSTLRPVESSSSSSHCTGESEKNDISLPETNPEIIRASTASARATICDASIGATVHSGVSIISVRRFVAASMAGKGSVSNSVLISETICNAIA